MSANRQFKLKFTLPSFQMCRSKDLSSFPGNPVPAIYRLSPVNHKAHYPDLDSSNHTSKIFSFAHGCQMCHDNKDNTTVKSRGRKSTSSVPSRRSNFLADSINEEESETLISCLTSFSDEFCLDETVHKSEEDDLIGGRHTRSVRKVERVRFQSLENRRGRDQTAQVKKKLKESFAVVKKSKDPYEDFKKSMLEMITEMEMSEAEDLEQLLQCFLALNSRSYHAVIVRAFMEIWQQMFTWNPTSVKNISINTNSN